MKHIFILILTLLPLLGIGQQPVMTRLGDWIDDSVQLRGSMQGMAIHGRYAVTLRHGGQCLLLDLKKKKCIGTYQLEDNTTHCNNASFSTTFLGTEEHTHKGIRIRQDKLPLLYVSSCYGDKACHVSRISDTGSTTIQRIYFDSPSFPVAQDWCVDATNGYLYAFGGRRGETMYLKKFALPKISSEAVEIRLTDTNVIQTIPITCVKVAQGSVIKNGYAYLPDGNEPGQYWLHIIDLSNGSKTRTIDLNDIGLEPEGVDVQGQWIYVSFHTSDPKENKIYRFRK